MNNQTHQNHGKDPKKDLGILPHDRRWRCERCQSTLAFHDLNDSNKIRIKYKDLIMYIYGPKNMAVICTQCAAYNEIEQNAIEKEYSFVIKDGELIVTNLRNSRSVTFTNEDIPALCQFLATL